MLLTSGSLHTIAIKYGLPQKYSTCVYAYSLVRGIHSIWLALNYPSITAYVKSPCENGHAWTLIMKLKSDNARKLLYCY